MAQFAESPPTSVTAKPRANAMPLPASVAGVRELLAVTGVVALADLTIYRGSGFAGLAALFAIGPLLLLLGSRRPALNAGAWLIGAMLALLSLRLIWMGSVLGIVCGSILLVAFAMALRGQLPF